MSCFRSTAYATQQRDHKLARAACGSVPRLAASGVMVFTEHARLIRAAGHLARYAANLRHRIRVVACTRSTFPYDGSERVVIEDKVARILEAAGLPVAAGCFARLMEEAIIAAEHVGFARAMKAISPSIVHRAAAGLVALDIASSDTITTFQSRAPIAAEGAYDLLHTLRTLQVTNLFLVARCGTQPTLSRASVCSPPAPPGPTSLWK